MRGLPASALALLLLACATFAQTPLLEFRGSQLEHLGYDVDGVGDVNADGFDDVAVTSVGGYVVRSGRDGSVLLSSSVTVVSALSTTQPLFDRHLVTGAGDVDGDGHADLLVKVSGSVTGPPGAFAVHSGATGATLAAFPHYNLVPAGDRDGDGVPDFVGRLQATGAVEVVSGAGGAVILTLPPPAGAQGTFGASVLATGDLNGDGIGDYLVGEPLDPQPVAVQVAPGIFLWSHCSGTGTPAVHALSGVNGSLIYSAGGTPNTNFGAGLIDLGDLTGDGAPEFAVYATGSECPLISFLFPQPGSTAGSLSIRSGSTGALLSQVGLPGPFYTDLSVPTVAGVGDITGDGLGDLVTGYPWFNVAAVIQGSAFSTIHYQLSAAGSDFWGLRVAAAGDVNGDGVNDILVADHQANLGGVDHGLVRVYSGAALPSATVLTLGGGCGPSGAALSLSGASLPLDPTVPSLHQWSVSGLFPGVQGVFALSPGPPVPQPLSPACALFVDPATLITLPAQADATGTWSLPLVLPAWPFLHGRQLTAQALFVTPFPASFDITNGLAITLGH